MSTRHRRPHAAEVAGRRAVPPRANATASAGEPDDPAEHDSEAATVRIGPAGVDRPVEVREDAHALDLDVSLWFG